MTQVEARFYDGKSSRQQRVLIQPQPPRRLRVTGDGIDFSCALAEVRSSSRVGNTRRHLYFADGSQCETEDNDAIDALFSGVRAEAPGRLLHLWESRLGYVLFALVLTCVLLWAGTQYGIPALAKQIAFRMPASTEKMLGREALEGLDKLLLAPTRLPPERQAALNALFSGLTSAVEGAGDDRLEFRAGNKIGANAFALPSGIIVITDELVNLAKDDGELVAVFAHEIGHLRQRHSLRRLLQNSATAILVIAVTGDVGSVASLSAALPTLLVESKYSRDFESEADDFAIDLLQRRGIPTESFAVILLRMEQQAASAGRIPEYLSSHPGTQVRAERARGGR
jgi:Zn-dependent protease with chaperone function